MELWIRSQDKEHLIKCETLETFDRNLISLVKDYVEDLKLEVMIIANDNTNLGTYKTKERALEVLDEIQHLMLYDLKRKYSTECFMNDIGNLCVYEMPQD